MPALPKMLEVAQKRLKKHMPFFRSTLSPFVTVFELFEHCRRSCDMIISWISINTPNKIRSILSISMEMLLNCNLCKRLTLQYQ